jgi:hypothetical protein
MFYDVGKEGKEGGHTKSSFFPQKLYFCSSHPTIFFNFQTNVGPSHFGKKLSATIQLQE